MATEERFLKDGKADSVPTAAAASEREASVTPDPVNIVNARPRILSEEAVQQHSVFATGRWAYVYQFFLLCAALPIFSGCGLAANWSVVVNVPPEAEYTSITPNGQAGSYGVELQSRPGSHILFVEEVKAGGIADSRGVLQGDTVARGIQGDSTIFTSTDFSEGDEGNRLLQEVMCYVGKTEGRRSCDLQVIDPNQQLQIDFDMAHVAVAKGEPYMQPGVILMRNVVGAAIFVPLAAVCRVDFSSVLRNRRMLWSLMFLSTGRSIAHIFEILANGKINAAVFSIVTQTRLVGTAAFCRWLLGAKQTTLQMLLLASISILVACYCQVPDSVPIGKHWNGFGAPWDPNERQPEQNDTLGMVYALTKTTCTVLIGAISQKILHDPALNSLGMVGLQAILFSVCIIPLFIICVFYMLLVRWEYGFFGGSPVVFRHCMPEWPAARCEAVEPTAIIQQGWDNRTCVLLFMYFMSEPIICQVVRVFSALTKDMTSAVAIVVTYFFSIILLGKEFNLAKCGLGIVVVLQVIQYAASPKYVEPESAENGRASAGKVMSTQLTPEFDLEMHRNHS